MLQWEATHLHTWMAKKGTHIFSENNINWTITYSTNADIYLPFGRQTDKRSDTTSKLLSNSKKQNKKKDAVLIVSHCKTNSKRELYVEIVRKNIYVDILRACEEEWKCGRRLVHDQCFDIYNTMQI